MSTSNLPHDKRLDGPPEGKEVVLVFEVRVTVEQHDEDDEADVIAKDMKKAIEDMCCVDVEIEHTGTEDA